MTTASTYMIKDARTCAHQSKPYTWELVHTDTYDAYRMNGIYIYCHDLDAGHRSRNRDIESLNRGVGTVTVALQRAFPH